LHRIILNEKADDALAIKASETLVVLERFKREMRGIPALKAAELREMPARTNRRRSGSIIMRDPAPPSDSL
jgi:hypothetical protein